MFIYSRIVGGVDCGRKCRSICPSSLLIGFVVNDFRRNRTLLNTFQSISGYKLVVSHKEVMSVNRRNTIGTPAILIRVLLISGDSLMMEGGTFAWKSWRRCNITTIS